MELKQRVNEFVETNDISMAALSRSIGYTTGSILSQWLHETDDKPFKGDRVKLEKALSDFLNNYDSRRSMPHAGKPFVKTNDFVMAQYVVTQAIKHRRMALLYGSPGSGKTTTIKKIAENLPEAIVIEADISMTAKTLFVELCRRLKIDNPPKTLYDMEQAVCASLAKRECVLFIDEGEHLPYRALEMIRRVWDFTGTPIIYSGTQILMDNITGDSRHQAYAQLKRRIRGKWQFKGLVSQRISEDGKVVDDDTELVRVCESYGVIGAAVREVRRLTQGNFGNTIDLLEQTKELCDLQGYEVSKEAVAAAAEMLLI